MKPVKIAIAVLGVVGVVAMFLPWVSMGEFSVKLWDARQEEALKAYLPLAGFLLAAIMGAMALAKGAMARWQGIVALVGFSLAMIVKEVRIGLTGEGPIETAIGGKLLFLAAALGIVASIIAIAKPEKA